MSPEVAISTVHLYCLSTLSISIDNPNNYMDRGKSATLLNEKKPSPCA